MVSSTFETKVTKLLEAIVETPMVFTYHVFSYPHLGYVSLNIDIEVNTVEAIKETDEHPVNDPTDDLTFTIKDDTIEHVFNKAYALIKNYYNRNKKKEETEVKE